MKLFDTHAHFDSFAAEGTVATVLQRAVAAGVARICAVGSSEASNELAAELASAHPDLIVAAVGYDRDQIDKPHDADKLAALASDPSVAAVGRSAWTTIIRRRPRPPSAPCSAGCCNSPRSGNCRCSSTAAMPTTTRSTCSASFPQCGKSFPQCGKNTPARHPALLHRRCAVRGETAGAGFLISFSGIVSFNNAGPLREVAKLVPEDRLLVETDCPYLTPKPFRGKVNEPAYLTRVAEVLAEARGGEPAALAAATFANACRLFQLEG